MDDSKEPTEENAWEKEEFGLEAALQKTHSQVPQFENFEPIDLDDQPDPPKPNTTDNTSNTPLSDGDVKEIELSRKLEQTSSEIFSIALGNPQQMETSKIVENITSKASSHSKSKFFNENDSGSDSDPLDAHDIFNNNNYTFRETNVLPTVKEEGYASDSSAHNNWSDDIFEMDPPHHRSTYSFGNEYTRHFDIYNDQK